ncbi:THAP domain-containing protein 1-like [Odontomachus brunneus]|uniref:THAP domain-containing protein 1-like n=1 Tax=Odontomachus brunneus TaxID=486640 RepID=UPI0013F205DC|nr:THAP domain-containing protein 1-like [Odontomachus brunneus]XP_032671454.1 THAP domain-containing protein 1-like [Odontomachus brunneus]
MVQNCCVTNCKNVWRRHSSIAYHTFPLKNEKRLAQWMQIDELKDINITAGKRICSVHFTPESFEEHCAVKRLKKNAVPSLFGDSVQEIDDSVTEIVEIWEEICTDNTPEETTVVLNEITRVKREVQQEVQQEMKQTKEQVAEETEKISQSNVEKHDLPVVKEIETKDASVQTVSVYYEYREEILDLRKKLTILRRQIKQRESSISSTRKYIHLLTKS